MSRRLLAETMRLIRSLRDDFPDTDRADGVIHLDGLRGALRKVRAAARRAALMVIPESVLRRVGGQANATNERAVSGQLQRIGTPATVARAGSRDASVAGSMNRWVRRNVGLIKTVPAQQFRQVESVVRQAFREGVRHEVLAQRLVERARVAQSRAKLIARDQVEKLNGQLTEERQTSLGIESYTWRTVGDDRVRPEHEAREGQVFEWGSPPGDGHPGEPINCRCWAEPRVPV